MLRTGDAALANPGFLRASPGKEHSNHSESPTRTSQYSRRSNSNDDILGGSEESSSQEKQTRKVNLAEHLNGTASEADQKPRSKESSAVSWHAPWDTDVVTVMIRQAPREYTQIRFLAELVSRGFEGLFDFIYFPFDLKKNSNIGYGFINFVDPAHAARFAQEFDYVYLDDRMEAKGKPLRVHAASVQGYQDNCAHFSAKAAQKQSALRSPLFFPGGSLAKLPEEVASALADLQRGPEAAARAPEAPELGAQGEGSGPPASLVEAISSAFAMGRWTPTGAAGLRAARWGCLGEAPDPHVPWPQLPADWLNTAPLAEPMRISTEGLHGSRYAASLGTNGVPHHALSGQFNTLEERRNQLLLELAAVQEEQRRTLVGQLLPGAGMPQYPLQPPGLL